MLSMTMPTRLLLLTLLFLLLGPGPASAQRVRRDQLPLGELIEIVVLEDELLAVDAEGGGTSTVRRRLGERVLWVGTRGLVGVVITDERVLAIATRSSWQEAPYERSEPPAREADLGDRVALVALPKRVLGFVGSMGRFAEVRLGPRENLQALRVGANVGVVVTEREAWGLSPDAGGFFPIRLQLREKLEEVVARDNLATVHTDQRILVFRSPTGTWAERRN
jgi:hypothetical protein